MPRASDAPPGDRARGRPATRRRAAMPVGAIAVSAAALSASIIMVGLVFGPGEAGFHVAARIAVGHIPDGSWGASWEGLSGPPAGYPRAALAALLRAVGPVAAFAAGVAVLSVMLHGIGRLLATWRDLTMRSLLGARPSHLVRLIGGVLGRPALLGIVLGTMGGLSAAVWFVAHWPSLLTRPANPTPGAIGVIAAAMLLASCLALVVLPAVALVERGVLRVTDIHGDHVTAHGTAVRGQSALAVLQLAAVLCVTYGGALVLRSAGVIDRGVPRPSADTTMVLPLRWTGDGAVAPVARAAAYARLFRALHQGGVPETAVTSPDAWIGLGKDLAVISLCDDCFIGSSFVPMSSTRLRAVTADPGALTRMGLRLERGREFAASDEHGASLVAVLSAAAAARLFPGADAVGRVVRLDPRGSADYRVVGIVSDLAPRGLGSTGGRQAAIYLAVLQHPPVLAEIAVPGGDVARVRDAVRATPGAPRPDVGDAYRLDDRRRRFEAPLTWFGALMGTLAIAGLGVALLSFAAVMVQMVRLRRREIAIRIAVGARITDVVRWLFGRAAIIIGVGLLLGLTVARWVGDLLGEHLGRSVEGDLWLLLRLMCALAVVGFVVTLLPAWRAARVEPAAAWGDPAT